MAKIYMNLAFCSTSAHLSMLGMLKIERFDSIIEVGCGPSLLMPHLLSRKKDTAKLHLSDLSGEMVSLSIQRMEKFLANPYKNHTLPDSFTYG